MLYLKIRMEAALSFAAAQLQKRLNDSFENETSNEPGAVRLYLETGTCMGNTKIPTTRANTKQSCVVFDACKTSVGEPRAPSEEVSPMASGSKAHSCPPAVVSDEAANSSDSLFFWRDGMHAYRQRDCGCRH